MGVVSAVLITLLVVAVGLLIWLNKAGDDTFRR